MTINKNYKLDSLSLDLHIHTNCSYDSFNRLEAIIRHAEKKGLNIIAITDHNCINNALKAGELLNRLNSNLKVIIGEEILTAEGEVIGLFLKKHVKPGKLEKIIENIKEQGGIVYLPHPFKRSHFFYNREIFKYVDIVEVFNSRCSYEQNYKALIFAIEQGKLMACGSDSHMISEIGRCRMIINTMDIDINNIIPSTFLNLVRNALRIMIIGSNKNFIKLECTSQFIKCIKERTLSPIKYIMRYIPFEVIYNKNNPSEINILLERNGDKLNIKVD